MKKKLIKIWGVGLAAVLMLTLVLAAVPVSAGPPLLMYNEKAPSTVTFQVVNQATYPELDINDIAVSSDGQTIYAACSATAITKILLKSSDGGTTGQT